MGHKWKYLKLKEAGVQLIDCIHKTPPAAENGYPYIGIPQMRSGGIDFSANPRLISKKHLDEWSVKAKPIQNDIILSRRCNPGETVYVPEGVEFALGQNLVILRASGELIYPPFLRWLVRGQEWWGEIGKYLNVGAVFDSLRCGDIPNFKLPIPPLSEQKRIAHILGSLDDKIELNRQMNATLEGMAQAIFKSWFVDFDPVIDNALAAGNPIPEAFTARAETRRKALADGTANRDVAKQFPATFQFTEEIGWIPEGWEISSIVKQAHLTMGQSPSSEYYNKDGNGLPFHQGVTNYGDRFPNHEQYSTKGNRYAEKGDILFSVRAPVGRINIADCNIIIGRGLSALRHKKNYQSFLVYLLKQTFQKEDSIGSGTVFNAVNKKDMESIQYLAPVDDLSKTFNNIANALDEKIADNASQTINIANLRDTLLPKLISGEIRISEAEKLTEEALA